MKFRTMVESAEAGRGRFAILLLMAGLLLWLWPIGVGGKMPVGGDVTQFFLGLMGVLGSALREGRLPIWNDLWGYGFPGIGESQMGVFYPPHLILYGFLPTEWAYVVSLLLHTLWGALGAWWAARRFGVTPIGSSLAAFAFSASGFFVIHMPHPWGYTTGAWMPWAWALTWLLLTSRKMTLASRLFLLSLVLVLQVLPGHFQIAFLTQVGIVLMVVWFVLEPWIRREWVEERTSGIPFTRGTRQALAIGGCLIAVFPLTALQLWPTARLARLAAAQRDFEYLSGFAATPWHLVNYIAPGLFHRSPLWRPLVWDPLHTTPEELLSYVGLVPFFLAILVVLHEFRRDRSVRTLAVVAATTLVLSFGPYFPGFRLLISVPGFSFFRAPAMEPGNRPGPVDPGGKGAGSLSRLAETGTIPGMADRPFGGLDSRRARADRAGPGQRLIGRASLVSRPLSEGFSVASLDGRLQSPRRAGRSPQAGGRPEDFRGKPSRDLRARTGRHDGSSCRDFGRRLAHFASFATRALAGLLDLADIP